mmetsp:Transcript_11395/g.26322  ORF Transcript_11395/g.26322 Transcript_11395/m.26322 type:complete len:302 (-) Transcript_11395:577-1482(-)
MRRGRWTGACSAQSRPSRTKAHVAAAGPSRRRKVWRVLFTGRRANCCHRSRPNSLSTARSRMTGVMAVISPRRCATSSARACPPLPTTQTARANRGARTSALGRAQGLPFLSQVIHTPCRSARTATAEGRMSTSWQQRSRRMALSLSASTQATASPETGPSTRRACGPSLARRKLSSLTTACSSLDMTWTQVRRIGSCVTPGVRTGARAASSASPSAPETPVVLAARRSLLRRHLSKSESDKRDFSLVYSRQSLVGSFLCMHILQPTKMTTTDMQCSPRLQSTWRSSSSPLVGSTCCCDWQ